MAEIGELELITCEDDWLELRTGESAIVRGKLPEALSAGALGILVSQPDWTDVHVEIPTGAEKDMARGTRVEIVVTRTEDGLQAVPGAITVKEEHA